MRVALMLWGKVRDEPSLYGEALERLAVEMEGFVLFSGQPGAGSVETHYLRFSELDKNEPFDLVIHDVDDAPGYATGFPYIASRPGILFLGDVLLHRFARAVSHSALDGWGYRWIAGVACPEHADELALLEDEGIGVGAVSERVPLAPALAARSAAVVVPDWHSWKLSGRTDEGGVAVIPPPLPAPRGEAWAGLSHGRFKIRVAGSSELALGKEVKELLAGSVEIELTTSQEVEGDAADVEKADLLLLPEIANRSRSLRCICRAIALFRPVAYVRAGHGVEIPEPVAFGLRPGECLAGEIAELVEKLANSAEPGLEKIAAARRWVEGSCRFEHFAAAVERMLPVWRERTKQAMKGFAPLEHPHRDLPAVERKRVLERFDENDSALAELAAGPLRELFHEQ